MIIGIGIDIVDMRLFDQRAERLLDHFTNEEIILAGSRSTYIQTISKRFAVKEAVVKALGTKDYTGGVSFQDIETKLHATGKPYVVLHRTAAAQLRRITPQGYTSHVDISITDDGVMAAAVALIHAEPLA